MRGAVSGQRSAVGFGWRGVVYGLASNALLPAAAGWAALSPRMRKHWSERIGWTLPAVEPGALWLHAASLGEGQAVAAVAAGLSDRWPELPLLRTASSDTGREQVLPVDDVRCLPLDVPWLQRRFIHRARPRALVLVEGELWPGLLMACAGRVPVAVLGLRVGEGTRRLARRFPGLWRGVLGAVGHWSGRDEQDAAWLSAQLGVEVPVVGDLKIEAPVASAALRFERSMLLAGSTREGDEGALLAAWCGLPDPPQLVLAPRHADRFDAVAGLLEASGLRWRRRSEIVGDRVPAELDALLLDSVGELAGLYPHAAAAFVGGTFDPRIGGHSAVEAARAGVTVVHGPEIHANASAFAQASCVRVASPDGLAGALAESLAAPRPEPVRGDAVAHALELLEPLVGASVPAEGVHRPWALPLVPAYRALASLRSRRQRQAAPCPVISVGNIASGGTGKTPVVRHLLRLLEARGVKAAVVSRGYRRSARGPFVRDSVGGPGTGDWLGDELSMLSRDGALVVSCPDRVRGMQRAVELGARICLLDDGFQQRDLRVDLDVVTVDALRPLAGGLLPAGELREFPAALDRAAVLWANHGALEPDLAAMAGSALRVRASYRPVGWLHRGEAIALEDGPRGRVAVLAGVARPGGFLRQLRRLGLVPTQRHVHRDHAWWMPAEIEGFHHLASAMPLVTTEKDLTRLPEDLPCWALRMELVLEEGEAELQALLHRFLRDHDLLGEGR